MNKLVVVAAVLLLVAVGEAISTKADRRQSVATRHHRRRTLFTFSSRWFKCPSSTPTPQSLASSLATFKDHPVASSGALASWDGPSNSFKYNAGFKSATTGTALSDLTMSRVDLCKLQPAVCKHDGAGACGESGMTTTDVSTTVCCPALASSQTCGAKGVTRAFMPQIDDEPKFKTWMLDTSSFGGNVAGFDLTETDNYDMDKLKPTQDEVFPDNTFPKLCKTPTAPAVPGGMRPVISSDDYIIDGHHRWSCWVYCSGLFASDGTTACTDTTSGKAKVNKANKSMDVIMKAVIKAAKNAWGGTGTVPPPGTKTPTSFYFASFAEVDERFGQHAHVSEEAAAFAFVSATRAKLAEYGFSLKGGDEALMTLWKVHHAPRLWN